MLHKFKNAKLETMWSIHPSYKKSNSFQRLEFFGDKILAFTMSSFLLDDIRLSEGDLSIRLAALTNKDILASIGKKFIKDKIVCTGQLTNSIISDCLEAYIAAVYLDGGDIHELIHNMWNELIYKPFSKNHKNQLQEKLQTFGYSPKYSYTINSNNEFVCTINVDNTEYFATGIGLSKKNASFVAAKNFLNKYHGIIK